MRHARAVCLDASVLVKLRVSEPHSDLVRSWVAHEHGSYTTPFCFYEALNIFKSKWKYRGQLTQDEYIRACGGLSAWYGGISRAGFVRDTDLTAPEALLWVRDAVASSKLDYSDAYQIYSVKQGYFSNNAGESRTVLATTDAELARVARAFGIRAIDLVHETLPA